MSAPVHARGDDGDDGAPDAKRQRLDDQGVNPDPTKMTIKLAGHVETFVVNRQTAIDNSLYFRTAMSGDWPNSSTGIIELEKGDYATPFTVNLLKEYFEYLEDITINADTDNDLLDDPIQNLEDFDSLAEFWLLADYVQSQTITDAIMEEFEVRSDDMELMTEERFKKWWAILGDQPVYEQLRGVMLALFVASDAFKEDGSRHTMLPNLPATAQAAVVDELIRQHNIVQKEVSQGLKDLEKYVEEDGFQELDMMAARVNKKVAARDFFKSYTDRRDRI